MSDDDDFMFEDEEGYDFEYEEEDGDEEAVGVETKYYNAKAQRDDPPAALREFQLVIDEDTQNERSDWGFKATKQIIKLHLKAGELDKVLERYDQMLDYVRDSVVTRNYAEKSINNMLERLTANADEQMSRDVYQRTLDVLKATQSERLWLRTSLRLAKILLAQQQYDELSALLLKLKRSCEDDNGQLIMERGTQLLEVNAVYLELYSARDQDKQLKDTYLQCEAVKSAVPHPRIMGYIRECGGKIYMGERNWAKAQSCFFDAFKNYDEAGSYQRVEILKYLVLASMLSESEVNPLSSPEAKSYENEPPIRAITDLVLAYERRDVQAFEHILSAQKSVIVNDSFVGRYVADLRRTFRMQAIEGIVRPYTRVRVATLARLLAATPAEVEELLIALILDHRLNGSIDQENGTLLLRQETTDRAQYESLEKWSAKISALINTSYAILG
ncbi:hypothetical protein IWW54_000475 [Coemansia sp. RSA 2705]|nr:hypothetical protein IWW54_000475 [Coemansia sp. RSA 2705]